METNKRKIGKINIEIYVKFKIQNYIFKELSKNLFCKSSLAIKTQNIILSFLILNKFWNEQ